MKSHFLALTKQVSPPWLCRSSACSREKSEVSSPLPILQMIQWGGLMDGLPPQGQEGRRPRLSLETATRWPRSLFYYYSRKRMPALLHEKISPAVSPLLLLSLGAQFREHIFLVQTSSSCRAVKVFSPQITEFQRAHCRWLENDRNYFDNLRRSLQLCF